VYSSFDVKLIFARSIISSNEYFKSVYNYSKVLYGHSKKLEDFPACIAIAERANLHSTTLLLYLVPKVNSLGDGVHEFPITRQTDSGILTVVVFI
jgi:hypothetical protein